MSSTEPVAAAHGRPKRADARRNYDAIVAAAQRAFASHGVATSLDDIARSAGVGPGTLYRRFPSRDDLIAAALLDRQLGLEREAEALSIVDDAAGAIRSWVRLLATYFSIYRGLPDSVATSMRDAQTLLGASCARLRSITNGLAERAANELGNEFSGDDVFLVAQAVGWATQPGGCSAGDQDRALRLFAHGLMHTRGERTTVPSGVR